MALNKLLSLFGLQMLIGKRGIKTVTIWLRSVYNTQNKGWHVTGMFTTQMFTVTAFAIIIITTYYRSPKPKI